VDFSVDDGSEIVPNRVRNGICAADKLCAMVYIAMMRGSWIGIPQMLFADIDLLLQNLVRESLS
jgi:hypothetical protein